MSTTTHGSNDDCLDVQSGKTSRCMGHESQEALGDVPQALCIFLGELWNTFLIHFFRADVAQHCVWLMKWVNERVEQASASRNLESDLAEDR